MTLRNTTTNDKTKYSKEITNMMEIPSDPTGLPRKVFNKHLDALMETGQLNPDILPYMSSDQQWLINELKKSIVRIKKKYARQTFKDTERAEGTEGTV